MAVTGMLDGCTSKRYIFVNKPEPGHSALMLYMNQLRSLDQPQRNSCILVEL